MVFHHGELRESGTHNELLAERGLYWRLYQLQYSDDKPAIPGGDASAGLIAGSNLNP